VYFIKKERQSKFIVRSLIHAAFPIDLSKFLSSEITVSPANPFPKTTVLCRLPFARSC